MPWVEIEVDLSAVVLTTDAAADRIHAAIESAITQASQTDSWIQRGDFSAVGCTVRLSGRVEGWSNVVGFIRDRQPSELVFERDGVAWAVVRLADETRPALDITELARQKTPVGRLAQLLQALEDEGITAVPPALFSGTPGFDPSLWVDDAQSYPLPDQLTLTKTVILQLLEKLLEQSPDAEVP